MLLVMLRVQLTHIKDNKKIIAEKGSDGIWQSLTLPNRQYLNYNHKNSVITETAKMGCDGI